MLNKNSTIYLKHVPFDLFMINIFTVVMHIWRSKCFAICNQILDAFQFMYANEYDTANITDFHNIDFANAVRAGSFAFSGWRITKTNSADFRIRISKHTNSMINFTEDPTAIGRANVQVVPISMHNKS